MKRRQIIQVVLLVVAPVVCFLIVLGRYRDSYLAVSLGYLTLLLILRFADLDAFLMFGSLRELWKSRSECEACFVLESATFESPVLRTTAKVVLGDANLYYTAKLKYAVGETGSFLPSIRDELMRLVFFNIILALALMMMMSVQLSSMPATGHQTAEDQLTHAQESTTQQIKLATSYFAVVLQLVWIGRILFHYRRKNADLYYQTVATQ